VGLNLNVGFIHRWYTLYAHGLGFGRDKLFPPARRYILILNKYENEPLHYNEEGVEMLLVASG